MRKRLIEVGWALALSVILGMIPWSKVFAQQNIGGSLLASGARTATASSPDTANVSGRGVHVIIVISAYTSGTWTPTIQGKDPVSGNYYTLLTGAGLTGTGTTVLKVYPGITASANVAASDIVPRTWRVQVAGSASPVATFSVGFSLIQ